MTRYDANARRGTIALSNKHEGAVDGGVLVEESAIRIAIQYGSFSSLEVDEMEETTQLTSVVWGKYRCWCRKCSSGVDVVQRCTVYCTRNLIYLRASLTSTNLSTLFAIDIDEADPRSLYDSMIVTMIGIGRIVTSAKKLR